MKDRPRGRPEKREPAVPLNKQTNVSGADVADQTAGTPISPEEWAEEQPLENGPGYAMEPGDPSPLQPSAGTPGAEEPAAPLPAGGRTSKKP